MQNESFLKRTICPGDFVFVSYDQTPIVEDMHCGQFFDEAVRDNQAGGHNDWYIEKYAKYPSGGFMVKAKRRLRTRDRFDWILTGEPEKILYGIHDSSWTFTEPNKMGVRGLKKFSQYITG